MLQRLCLGSHNGDVGRHSPTEAVFCALVSKWLKGSDCKSGVPVGTVAGSNPSPVQILWWVVLGTAQGGSALARVVRIHGPPP